MSLLLSIVVSFSSTVFTSAELASVQCILHRKLTSCSLIEILRNVYTKLYKDTCSKMTLLVCSLIWNP